MKFRSFFGCKAIIAAAALSAATSSIGGTTYKFTVTCPDARIVESWETGDIDPGREYLRVITGTRNPGCSVTDFNPTADSHLPVQRHSDVGGVLDGLPPFWIIKGILGS